MAGLRRGLVLAAAAVLFAAAMLPEAAAVRYTVGDKWGWTSNSNVNYTIWAQGKHFHTEDWLFFVYDRNQMNVLEVNKTNYENCISDHPLHNWTTGAGRDVVPLNVTKTFYFISGNGGCFGGMKVAVPVEKTPPPPKAAPAKSGTTPSSPSTFRSQIFVPALFAVAAVWDSILLML
ncbi:hypothetical protein ACS0TY_028424 [Phlomoides rotata]